MANVNLTIDDITRESLRILHQKMTFVPNITTGYDSSFAKDGAKIGTTLRIRHPIQYSSSTGATIATGTGADSIQSQTTLTVNTQRHVPMRFTSNELTMDIDSFSKRHLEPAMAILAAGIENDALNMQDEVANTIAAGASVTWSEILDARKILNQNVAPLSDRCALMDSQGAVDVLTDTKGLFQDSSEIAKQYKEGMMGRSGGFDFFENPMMKTQTTGTEGGGTAYRTNAATAQVGSTTNLTSMSLIVDTGTKTITEGSVFTIEDCYDVHPETKQSTGVLKQFVALAAQTGAGTMSVSPALIATGPYQNCNTGAANNKKLTFIGAASTAYKRSLLFQKGFAVFGTADLVLPKGTHMASRQVYDDISMRIIQDYDVVKDRVFTRLDVLYGYKVLRPQLAVGIHHT